MGKTDLEWENRIGRRLKLRDLHILSVAVDRGSMSKAASHLAMSQAAVSEAIANLEAMVRVRLLDRFARGIVPTIYGSALLKRSGVVFDELRQGLRDIEYLQNPSVGEVRVACSDLFAAGLLPAAIDRLSRRFPDIVVRVTQADVTTLEFRELRERTVDLVVARTYELVQNSDLQVQVLGHDRHFVVAGAKSPWARRRKVSLTELIDERWIFPATQVIRTLIGDAFLRHGLKAPQERVSASSILLRSKLLATGRFLDVLPDSLLLYNPQWSLKALPVDLGVAPRSIAMVTLENRTLSPVVQVFIEHLRATARSMLRKV